ncbi:MAG: D-2-hydroxyacid dehydrogenase [Candidatus Rokubacteria bacterium]|nr:D-2-hydroxyacid dehydrogenase [Candidatus Rokubacteria bacterium]
MTSRRVLLYHPGQAEAYARLVRAPRRAISLDVCSTPAEAAARMADTEILYAWKFPSHLLARASRLRWIQAMGAGVEEFFVPDLPPRVIVTRATGMFGAWMAEYTLGWCTWVTQRMEAFREAQHERRWRALDPEPLHGRTLAIVGLGDIGRQIARAGAALGMRVIGVSRSGRPQRGLAAVYRPSSLARALRQADFAVSVLPLTEETRGLIGEAELRAMKPTAWLLNIGRGAVIQEPALVRALGEKWIAGGILDVFDTEPLPPDHPLWALPNVVITPHIAGPSVPAEIAPVFNANLRRYLAGQRLRFVVDRARGY